MHLIEEGTAALMVELCDGVYKTIAIPDGAWCLDTKIDDGDVTIDDWGGDATVWVVAMR